MVRSLLARLALIALALFLTAVFLQIGLRIAFYHSKDFFNGDLEYAVRLKLPVIEPDFSFAHAPNGHAFLMGSTEESTPTAPGGKLTRPPEICPAEM